MGGLANEKHGQFAVQDKKKALQELAIGILRPETKKEPELTTRATASSISRSHHDKPAHDVRASVGEAARPSNVHRVLPTDAHPDARTCTDAPA